LVDIKESSVRLTRRIGNRLHELATEVEWLYVYLAQITLFTQQSNVIITGLETLVDSIAWLKTGVLSPNLVSNIQLSDMLLFIESSLEHHGIFPLLVLPKSVAQLHDMMSMFHAKIGQNLLVSLSIPLSTYPDKLQVYKVLKHHIKVPNSNFSTSLDSYTEYIAIDKVSGDYIILNDRQKFEIQRSPHYILRNTIIRKDSDVDCIMSIYFNLKRKVGVYCHYVLQPTSYIPTATRLGVNKYLLQNIDIYEVTCMHTIHTNNTFPVNTTRNFTCSVDCIRNLEMFNFPDMGILLDQQNEFDSFTCVSSTNTGLIVPFTLDNSISKPGAVMNRFPVNLVVLNKFYTDDQLAALDGSSTYNYPPIVDIPEI